jgi:hypothetical protein
MAWTVCHRLELPLSRKSPSALLSLRSSPISSSPLHWLPTPFFTNQSELTTLINSSSYIHLHPSPLQEHSRQWTGAQTDSPAKRSALFNSKLSTGERVGGWLAGQDLRHWISYHVGAHPQTRRQGRKSEAREERKNPALYAPSRPIHKKREVRPIRRIRRAHRNPRLHSSYTPPTTRRRGCRDLRGGSGGR